MIDRRPTEIRNLEALAHGEVVVHEGRFATVYFGPGAADRLDEIVVALGADRPAIVCTPGRAAMGEALRARLSKPSVLMAEAVLHTPMRVSDIAAEKAVREHVDLVISVGGGSSIGLGKALTKRLGVRHVALPTTYSGAELTPFLGEAVEGAKLRTRHERLRPVAIIYDRDLGMTLPAHVSAASGMNAMAHAVGALTTSQDDDIRWSAEMAVNCLFQALPRIKENPADAPARAQALYGAWLGGYCTQAPMGLHHNLCHALGGVYGMPHAETHATLAPYSFEFNSSVSPCAVEKLSAVFGIEAAAGLFDFVRNIGLTVKLGELGLPEEGIPKIARTVCKSPYQNPRPYNDKDIINLLTRAQRGERIMRGRPASAELARAVKK